MGEMDEPASQAAEPQVDEPRGLRCDFCGKSVERVRRIALDSGYDRLQTPHPIRYACPECSEAKERSRKPASA
jgi:hypothetical protein